MRALVCPKRGSVFFGRLLLLLSIALTLNTWAAPLSNHPYSTVAMDPEYQGEGNHLKFRRGHFWRVKYLEPDERKKLAISFQNGAWINTNGQSVNGFGIYVMDSTGTFYFKPAPKVGRFHHSSFLSGKEVAGAGHMSFKNGKLIHVDRLSGHYKPPEGILNQVLLELHRVGENVEHLSPELSFLIQLTHDTRTERLNFEQLFWNYQRLREGTPEQAKHALEILVADARGRTLLEKEFQFFPMMQDPLLQERYARFLEDLRPRNDPRFKFLETSYMRINWWEPEEILRERLRRLSTLFDRLPKATENAALLAQSLNLRLISPKSREFRNLLNTAEFKPLLDRMLEVAPAGSPLRPGTAPPSPSHSCLSRVLKKLLRR